jgi:hypothetical protein
MVDELLARLAALIRMTLAGERKSIAHLLEVDGLGRVGGVLGDDREEIGEQLALARREVGVTLE